MSLAREVGVVGGLECHVAFLEHDYPRLDEWLDAAVRSSAGTVCCLGLLLSDGYHAEVDVPSALNRAQSLGDGSLCIDDRGTLGSGTWLMRAVQRAVNAFGGADSPLVLISAGSSQPKARHQAYDVASRIARQHRGPVVVAAASGPEPRLGDAIAALRTGQADVIAVQLMLAPGVLSDRIADEAGQCGVRALAPPLAAWDDRSELVDELVARLS
jgi:sirohydrochlorin ferrochelatase